MGFTSNLPQTQAGVQTWSRSRFSLRYSLFLGSPSRSPALIPRSCSCIYFCSLFLSQCLGCSRDSSSIQRLRMCIIPLFVGGVLFLLAFQSYFQLFLAKMGIKWRFSFMRCQIIKIKVVNPCLGLGEIPTDPAPNKCSFQCALELGSSMDPSLDPSSIPIGFGQAQKCCLTPTPWTWHPSPFSSGWE